MVIHFLVLATWGPLSNSANSIQRNYWRIPFAGTPNLYATSYLSEFSGGLDENTGVTGVAVATFKRYEYLDASGIVQEVDLPAVSSYLTVNNCVSITLALDLTRATGMLGATFYFI
jgi:hypothetical protein